MSAIPTSERDTALEAHLGYWLRLVSTQVSGAFARALQQYDLSVAEWALLNSVGEHSHISGTELAARLRLTRGGISKIIAKLEGKRWIVRVPSPMHARLQQLTLTAAGYHVLPKLRHVAKENDWRCFNCLRSSERRVLLSLMRKLAAHNHSVFTFKK